MLLTINQLTKQFGGLSAVNDVSAVIEESKITAIIGPNGAGKSTFFNLISGFHQPTSGRIELSGQDITNMRAEHVARLGVGRTFQTTHLFEQATVLDNVLIGHRLRTKAGLFDAIFRTKRERDEKKKCLDKALEALEFVGLTSLAYEQAHSITQEQQKRVAFALALATDPKLVLLDEPAAGVNPDETEGLSEVMKKMVKRGKTVCLIEHKMPMVMSLADHILVLNHGELIANGTPKDIQKNERVIEAYLGGNSNVSA
ncbi:ABC transporter ATP-binding protein [Alkalihalophilus marmarensis]|jgi:branched-chain amino acid transport system ATP-binding protein|uniref:ABC transporter ATP-binding protein n=1 Tax=Alkalihalophilus marmarensis DSM 21297 TaxID=1188261 RepID=U6SVP1_9BACI|nr:ABC transporter ATP-binding protein [Alkalihalophilus marmarensis]ERN54746.1 ABC transporter ATP-binding protein [Alkalihalophilus marmarensis DSM 21297]MCM3488633.1 ABC transporter ATP-binding protein [Alkalihalophilus marmarensis]